MQRSIRHGLLYPARKVIASLTARLRLEPIHLFKEGLIMAALFDQHLEDGVHLIAVELDGELCPEFIRQIVELPACGYWQEQRLSAFVYGDLGNLNGVGQDFDGAA